MGLVHERFAAAFAAMEPVRKGERNSHHGYAYRGIDTIRNVTEPVMAEHKLFYVPRLVAKEFEDWETSAGNRKQLARLDYEFEWYTDDGSSFTAGPVTGQTADTDDKACSQALSVAARLMLIEVFNLPTGDEEADSRSPMSEEGGRISSSAGKSRGGGGGAGATDKQKDTLRKLGGLPPEEKRKAQYWIEQHGGVEGISKRDASTVIDALFNGKTAPAGAETPPEGWTPGGMDPAKQALAEMAEVTAPAPTGEAGTPPPPVNSRAKELADILKEVAAAHPEKDKGAAQVAQDIRAELGLLKGFELKYLNDKQMDLALERAKQARADVVPF